MAQRLVHRRGNNNQTTISQNNITRYWDGKGWRYKSTDDYELQQYENDRQLHNTKTTNNTRNECNGRQTSVNYTNGSQKNGRQMLNLATLVAKPKHYVTILLQAATQLQRLQAELTTHLYDAIAAFHAAINVQPTEAAAKSNDVATNQRKAINRRATMQPGVLQQRQQQQQTKTITINY